MNDPQTAPASTFASSIAEILGLFLVVIGCGAIVAAASLISTALAVLAAGLFLMLGGVLVVYVATTLDRAQRRKDRD